MTRLGRKRVAIGVASSTVALLFAFSAVVGILIALPQAQPVQAVSQPLVQATAPVTATFYPPPKPQRIVQSVSDVTAMYKFLLNGAAYAWNDRGDNVTLSPALPAGFTPTLSTNSTFFQYTLTLLGCTVTSYFKAIPNSVSLTHKFLWSKCPALVGVSLTLNFNNLKGFTGALQSDGCTYKFGSIAYSWCSLVATGGSVSFSGGTIKFSITAASGIIDPTVQQTVSCTTSCAFGSNTLSGSIIIGSVQQISSTNTCPGDPTFSGQSLTYTILATKTATGANQCGYAAVFYSTSTSAAALTISITAGSCSGCTTTVGGTEALEVSGTTVTGATSAVGTGTSSAPSTASFSFSGSPFLIASEKGWGAQSGATPAAGTGFTLKSQDGGDNAEYATSGISSPTTFPFTFGTNPDNWVEVGAQFPSQATEKVTLTISPVGAANQGATTISGCNPSRTTLPIDGTQYTFTADASCSITYTVAAAGSNVRDEFSPLSTTWSYSTTSGTDTKTNTVYHQQSASASYSGTVAASGAPSFSGTQLGAANTATLLTTTPATLWYDSGTAFVITKPTADFPTATHRYETNFANASMSAGVTVNPAFYQQWKPSASYSGTVAASGAPSFACQRFGSASTDVLTTTATGLWADDGCAFTITKPTADFPSATHRYNTNYANGTISSASTVAPVFYQQWKPTFTASANGATTYDANLGTLAVTANQFGASVTACTISPTSGQASNNCVGWADDSNSPTVPFNIGTPPTSTQWVCAASGTCSFGSITSAGTPTIKYYKQGSMTSSYSISDALGICSAPTLTYTNIGSAGTTYVLPTTGTAKFIDWGSTPTVTNPSTGSTTTERCVTTFTMPTISAGGTINPVYTHQGILNNPSSLSITRTNNGTSATTTSAKFFCDITTSTTVSGTYPFSFRCATSVQYVNQEGSQGFGILSSVSISAITYAGGTPNNLKWVGTASTNATVFESSALQNTVGAVSKFYSNGNSITTYAWNPSTGFFVSGIISCTTNCELDFVGSGVGGGGGVVGSGSSSSSSSNGGGGGGGSTVNCPTNFYFDGKACQPVSSSQPPPSGGFQPVGNLDQLTAGLGSLLGFLALLGIARYLSAGSSVDKLDHSKAASKSVRMSPSPRTPIHTMRSKKKGVFTMRSPKTPMFTMRINKSSRRLP